MKREVKPAQVVVVIALLLFGIGFLVWRSWENPLNRAGAGEEGYRIAEEMVRKRGGDPRVELGKEYYRYHPEERKNMHGNIGMPVSSPGKLDAFGHWPALRPGQ